MNQPNQVGNVWSDAMITVIREMLPRGYSRADIAGEINARFQTKFTRNSVIGKINRLGIGDLPPRRERKPAEPKGKPSDGPALQKIKAVARKAAAGSLIKPGTFVCREVDTSTPLRLSVLQLTNETCKYEVSGMRPQRFEFCGHQTKPGSVYCEAHHAICYVKMDRSLTKMFLKSAMRKAA